MVTLKQINVEPREGLKHTLNEMVLLQRLAMEKQDFVTWVFKNFSSNCVGCIPGKIFNYMKNNFTYKEDFPSDELLIAPYLMREYKAGDCDDFSLFAKTCLDILGGFYTNYLLLGKKQSEFTHIVCFVHRGKVFNNFVDPVVIDGTNENFNIIPTKYNFYKII